MTPKKKCQNSTISDINRDCSEVAIITTYLKNKWIDDPPIALRLLEEANHRIFRLERNIKEYKDQIQKIGEVLDDR